MIISLISPVHGQAGCTVSALAIALTLSLTQNKKTTCITHTDMTNTVLADYTGKEDTLDMSTNLSQVATLLSQKGISSEIELKKFTSTINSKLSLYTSGEQLREEKEMISLYEVLIPRLPYDYTVIDIDTGLEHYLTKTCLKLSDTIVIVVNQNIETYKRLHGWISKTHVKKMFKDKKVFYMVNHYDTSASKNLSSSLKVSSKQILTLRHNPILQRKCNEGDIQEVFESALNKNGNVLEYYTEM